MTKVFPLLALSFALLPLTNAKAAPTPPSVATASTIQESFNEKKPAPRPTPKPGPREGGEDEG